MPALASAWRITRCCDGPLGAVSPFVAPSWLIAEPRMTASTRCPSRRASDNRSSTTTPTPSAGPKPSARLENALQRPSGANPRSCEKSKNITGDPMTVTPPASASEHSPARNPCTARCSATNDEEHAVSTANAGPSSPST
jgi:hypothetical protein